MGRLRTKMAESQYKENGKLLTEQFASGLNDDGAISEIRKGVATLEDTKDTTREHVFSWAYRVEAQWPKKTALNDIKRQMNLTFLNTVCRSKSVWYPKCRKR